MPYMTGPAALATAVTAALLVAAPAGAVTNGIPDGDGHPNVGALVAELPGVWKTPLCSGTLIAPTVFLTAGHCTAWLPGAGIERVWVTFDTDLDPERWSLIEGVYRTDPAFGHDRADLHDLAVVLLSRPAEGITPASLPAAGLLDRLASRGGFRDQVFTNVGYGFYERTTGDGPPQLLYDGVRRVSTSPFAALRPSWLQVTTNSTATDEGGVCYGDSGGPHFLGSSNTLVAITSGGDTACAGANWNYRLDTPAARQFLAQFVALP